MSDTPKIDSLDLIISVLREHEKKRDEFIARLEGVKPGEPVKAAREYADIVKGMREEGQGARIQFSEGFVELSTIPQPVTVQQGGWQRSQRREYTHPSGDSRPHNITAASVKTYLERTGLADVNRLEYKENAQGVLVTVKADAQGKTFLGDTWQPINNAVRDGLGGQWDKGSKGWVIPT